MSRNLIPICIWLKSTIWSTELSVCLWSIIGQCSGDWLRQGVLRDWVCLLQPASFIYLSLLSLNSQWHWCHVILQPLLARNSFIYLQVDQNFQQIYRTVCSSCGRQSTAWHGRPWRTRSCPHRWPRPPRPSWSHPPACAGHLACRWTVPHCCPDNN